MLKKISTDRWAHLGCWPQTVGVMPQEYGNVCRQDEARPLDAISALSFLQL